MSVCGTLAYGAFQFPETFNHSVSTRPWYGADEASVKGTECLLTVEFMLYSGMERAFGDESLLFYDYVEKVRNSLLAPRLNLVIRGTGWAFSTSGSGLTNQPDVILGSSGGISPVSASVVADLNNGPLPQSLDFEPIAGINAVKCTWKCLFWYNKCASASASSLIEYNYGTSFSVDKSGRTKITITGTYGFSGGNLFPNQKVLAIRDHLRIQPIVPLGFELLDQSHNINPTGTRVDFRFEIQEIASENAYFPFTAMVDGRHQASSFAFGTDATSGTGFSSWGNKLDVSVNLLPKINPRYAYEVFLWILMQRTSIFGSATDCKKDYPVPFKNSHLSREPKDSSASGRVFVKRLTITEGLYSNSHNFSVEWFVTFNLDQLLHQTGLFKPITSSLNDGLPPWFTAPRENKLYADYLLRDNLNEAHFKTTSGNSENRKSHLYFFENSNVLGKLLFDPCAVTNPPFPGGEYTPALLNPIRTLPNNLFPCSGSTSFGDFLPAESTFLDYEVEIEVKEESRAYQIPINSADAVNQQQVLSRKNTSPNDFVYSNPSSAEGYFVPPTGADGVLQPGQPGTQQGAVVVAGGENTYTITMKGSAKRIQFPISCPAISSVENNLLFRSNGSTFTQKRVNAGNVPLYEARWNIIYVFNGAVSKPHGDLFSGQASSNAMIDNFI
jgi:hypothetical protein